MINWLQPEMIDNGVSIIFITTIAMLRGDFELSIPITLDDIRWSPIIESGEID